MLLPTGVRFGSYATEGRLIHTRPQALWFAGFLLALLILFLVTVNISFRLKAGNPWISLQPWVRLRSRLSQTPA